ncbi:MAG: LacI family DNA-binding transcriptional regulator [Treponema sp.]|jgi:DNA-binding LacI/PurR family transcriptional regulator|nr:LacI family DNA-binding transcriptional regulator [Treponema sp.]
MKKIQKTTIQEIAGMAGVSIATVSRVMNHKGNVREDTRHRILTVLEKNHLNPSSVFLTDQASRTILICAAEIGNSAVHRIISGIQSAAGRSNYRVFILQSKETQLGFDDYREVLHNHTFAGIILIAAAGEPELLETITRSCPLVICAECCDTDGVSVVNIDDAGAARKAADYLVSCGCRKIALMNSSARYSCTRRREEGYTEALEKAGLERNDDWIVHISQTSYNLAFSYGTNLLSLPNRPDGILAVSDVYAIGAIHAARRLGIRVPEDLSVIGFDNISVSSMVDPPLTTLDQPMGHIGCQACELLIERIHNPLATPKKIILDAELIVRESTGAADVNRSKTLAAV